MSGDGIVDVLEFMENFEQLHVFRKTNSTSSVFFLLMEEMMFASGLRLWIRLLKFEVHGFCFLTVQLHSFWQERQAVSLVVPFKLNTQKQAMFEHVQ